MNLKFSLDFYIVSFGILPPRGGKWRHVVTRVATYFVEECDLMWLLVQHQIFATWCHVATNGTTWLYVV